VENRQLKSSRRAGPGKVLQEIHPNKGANSPAKSSSASKSSVESVVEVKPYREIHSDGSITRLRGWFFTYPEVKALYNNPDTPIRKTFRSLISKLTDEERRVFYNKGSQSPVQYKINPAQNDGLNYAYVGQLERRQAERRKLLGFSCEECDAVGLSALPVPSFR
jgi:hypothetical protein